MTSTPLYVYTTSLIHRRRKIIAVSGVITIQSPANAPLAPSVKYSITGSTARSRQLLSLVITSQSAESLPIDCRLSICNAPRQYIIRRGIRVEDLDEELVTDGVAYIDDARSLAFCSLDAIGFDPGSVTSTYVSRRHPHAYLLREVAMAQELETMHPLKRKCASRAALSHAAPLEASDVLIFTREALEQAREFIARELVPHTRRMFDIDNLPIAIVPLHAGTTNEEVLATITFRAYVVVE